jgi:hypothetical protein
MFISEKRLYCVYVRTAFLNRVYNYFFCEVDILSLSEKRICVFLCREYNVFSWKVI